MTLKLSLFYYGPHTPEVDSAILGIKPQYVIINTSQGLWGQISSHNVFQEIPAYHAAGIKIIGYITAGYEGLGSKGNVGPEWYTLAKNEQMIKNMAQIDGVDGVFIDECSAFPNDSSREYLKALTDYAHSFGLITWGNVGQADFDPWFFTQGGFDLMHSNEDWAGQSLSEVQRNWGYRISITGSNPGYTAQQACDLTVKAWQMGLAYCYISNVGYDSVASWLADYSSLLIKNKLSQSGTTTTNK